MNSPVSAVGSVFEIIGNFRDVGSIIAFFLTALFGITNFGAFGKADTASDNGPSIWGPILDFFAVKVLIFILVSAALGWSFATVNGFISARKSEMATILGYLFSLAWAITFVGLAGGMFISVESYGRQIYLAFSVAGVCIAIVLAMAKFREDEGPDVRVLRYKSGVSATFAAATAIMTVATYLTVNA